MKCVIIKSFNPQRKPIQQLHDEDYLDEYIYTYYKYSNEFDIDNLDDYCRESDDDKDPAKFLQLYRGKHWILNCVDFDDNDECWRKKLKEMYPKLII